MSSPYFSDTLKSLIGYSIGIFSDNGTLVKGRLVNVKKDHLILQNEDGEYFYYHLKQIKSVSKNTKRFDKKTIQEDYLQAEKLQEILEYCKHKWITINCHNDQLIEGYLSGVFEDHIILISSEEKIVMQTAYISNIFPGSYEGSDSAATTTLNEKETALQDHTEYANRVQQEFSEEKSQENHPISEKKARSVDYSLFDQKFQSYPFPDSRSLSTSHDYEERKEPIKNSKTFNNHSMNSSNPKNRFSRKKRSNKKLRINKKEMKLSQVEEKEKEIDKQTTLLPATKDQHIHINPILTPEERDKVLESQYYSLMKQAETNYMNLKKKRLARENL